MSEDFDKYYEATEPGMRERAYAWATAIGLQDVDGLKPSKYLRSRGYTVTNDLFAEKSYYFRNALVRANYENDRLGVEKTQLPLEEFFKVLIFGAGIELHNRFLRIGQEYGTRAGEVIKGLHRREDVIDDGINDVNDGINDGITCGNDGIKFSASEEKAIKLILQTPTITAVKLAEALACKKRHAERIIASLKKKAGLVREGSRKSGIWRFSKRVNV